MDWSKLVNMGNKAQNILAMAKESFNSEEMANEKGQEKSLFGKQEKQEIELLNAQMVEQKKKQEQTLMYVIGALILLMFTGILKIGK